MKNYFFKIFTIIILSTLMSCNSNQNKTSKDNQKKSENIEVSEISIAEFMEFGNKYVGKTISIKGIVEHVCKHSGKRMFVVGNNPGERVQVSTGKKINTFDINFVGNNVIVYGIVREKIVDEAYLLKWEQEVNSGAPESLKIHDGGIGHKDEAEEDEKQESLDKINNFRKILKEKSVDHLSLYSIECEKYEILK